MTYFNRKLDKAREESFQKDPVAKEKFRGERRKFSRDSLANQVTAVPGVSDRGIAARRGDTRNKGVVSHGYGRVLDAQQHKQQARDYFRAVKESQSKIKPNLPKSELTAIDLRKAKKKKTESDEQKYQKDWIIPDFTNNNLWCLSIGSKDGENWCLIEWVNLIGTSNNKMQESVNMGYHTMLQAMKDYKYEYVYGPHKFSPNRLNTTYWKGLVKPHGKFVGKTTIALGKAPVNKENFEAEINKIFKSKTHSGQKNTKLKKDANFFDTARHQSQVKELGSMATKGPSTAPQDALTQHIRTQRSQRQGQRDSAIQSVKDKRAKMGNPIKPVQETQLPGFFNQHKGVIPHDHPHRKQAVDFILNVWRKSKGDGMALSDKYLTGKRPKKPNIYAHMKSEVLLTPCGKYKSDDKEIFGIELLKSENQLIDYIILFKKSDGSLETQPSFIDNSRSIASSILRDYKDKIS